MVGEIISKNGRSFLRTGTGEDRVKAVENWLNEISSKHPSTTSDLFEVCSSVIWGLKILQIDCGRTICTFIIPDRLVNEDGNWTAGAIAGMIDIICAISIIAAIGEIKLSVSFNITYYTPAKSQEEVEIEGKVLFDVGKLTNVLVEIKKKRSGELVAVGKQWMSSIATRSKI
ncbi:hypothetical protein ZOSMA_5G02000 [Zostera marina]|uniref:Thioesterase domain-containing protein n=1 Tax=Zostera marina TaxID=29655 RepID=A0A0K9NUM4_ZOSMR|nr:hypothetical protein ZOSMA_5G02000 [Zostera marina]